MEEIIKKYIEFDLRHKEEKAFSKDEIKMLIDYFKEKQDEIRDELESTGFIDCYIEDDISFMKY